MLVTRCKGRSYEPQKFHRCSSNSTTNDRCIYDRYFDIEWDEEVLLHDGRVIIVHVKNTYERRGGGLKKYDETKITFRRKELIFEAAPGKFVTFSTRMPVAYLGNFDNDWFVVISGQGPYGNYPELATNTVGK